MKMKETSHEVTADWGAINAPKADWNDKEMVQFVDELIHMHRGTYIDLFTWPLALSIVKRYYDIEDEYLTSVTKKEEEKSEN